MSTEPELKIGVTVATKGNGLKETERDVEGVAKAAAKAGAKTAEAGQRGAEGLRETAKTAKEATEVVRGLEEASEGGIQGFIGLAKAGRAFGNVLKGALAGNPFGLLLAGLSAAAGLFLLFRKNAAGSAEELKKNQDQADALNTKLAALTVTAETFFERQSKGVKKLAEDFDKLYNQIDKFRKLNQARNEAADELETAKINQAEEQALSKAKTPEAKDAIRQNAERQRAAVKERARELELDAERSRLEIEKRSAEDELASLSSRRLPAFNEASKLKSRLDIATDAAKQKVQFAKELPEDKESQEAAEQALAHAHALKEAYEKAIATLKEIDAEIDKRSSEARGKISDSREEQDVIDTKKETAKIDRSTRAQSEKNTDTDKINSKLKDTSSIQKQIDEAEADKAALEDAAFHDHDFRLGGTPTRNAADKKGELIQSLKDQLAATEAKNSEVTSLFKAAAKKERKTAEQLKNMRPGT